MALDRDMSWTRGETFQVEAKLRLTTSVHKRDREQIVTEIDADVLPTDISDEQQGFAS